MRQPLFIDRITPRVWVDVDDKEFIINELHSDMSTSEITLNPDEAERLLDILVAREQTIRWLAQEWRDRHP